MDAMKEQINTVNDFNRYVISDSDNSASSEVKAFTTYMKSEKQRDEATFSLLIHVGNALSPPGLNVGSVLKAVKSVVKLPDLDDKEMDKIATEVMTVNKNYKALTAQAKNDG